MRYRCFFVALSLSSGKTVVRQSYDMVEGIVNLSHLETVSNSPGIGAARLSPPKLWLRMSQIELAPPTPSVLQ